MSNFILHIKYFAEACNLHGKKLNSIFIFSVKTLMYKMYWIDKKKNMFHNKKLDNIFLLEILKMFLKLSYAHQLLIFLNQKHIKQ